MADPWTPARLRALEPLALETLYAGLTATALPVGSFTGLAWGRRPAALWMFSRWLWQGKVFTGDRVRNAILGQEWIEGRVTLDAGEVTIHYPQLGLTDHLKPVSDTLWLGRMTLGAHVVWFALAQEASPA